MRFLVHRFFVILSILVGAFSLSAQVDILADEPISIGEDDVVEARGNVVIEQDNLRLRADSLRVEPRRQRFEAQGNLRFERLGRPPEGSDWDSFQLDGVFLPGTRGTLLVEASQLIYDWSEGFAAIDEPFSMSSDHWRLVAPGVRYDLNNRTAEAGSFRLGNPFVLIKGSGFFGEESQLTSRGAILYLSEPGPWSLNFRVREVQVKDTERVRLEGATARVGSVPVFYFPALEHDLERPPISGYARLGYRNRLGAFARLSPLIDISPTLGLGGSLELYSRRGVLFGPRFRYRLNHANGWSGEGEGNLGYIDDRGPLETDILGRMVPRNRYFVDWNNRLAYKDNFQIISVIDGWSDSEIIRDFRPQRFETDQTSRAFVEAIYRMNQAALVLHGDFRLNTFQSTIERLPELGFEWYPQPVGPSHLGLTQMGFLRAAVLRRSSPFEASRQSAERFDSYYGLRQTFGLSPWLSLTGIAGARGTLWTGVEGEPYRVVGEIGADLRGFIYGDYEADFPVWDFGGIRHTLQPVTGFRIRPATGAGDPLIPEIEERFLVTGLPSLDLYQDPAVDIIGQEHFIRIGLENTFSNLGGRSPGRSLLRFDIYQDFVMQTVPQSRDDSFFLRSQLTPADWLDLTVRGRYSTEKTNLEDYFVALSIRDRNLWRLRFAAEKVESLADQFRIDGFYRWRERHLFTGLLNYDREISRINERRFAWRFPVVQGLDGQVSVISRSGTTRESEFQVTVEVFPKLF